MTYCKFFIPMVSSKLKSIAKRHAQARRQAMDQARDKIGRFAKTGSDMAEKLDKKDLLVNTAGFLSSIAGERMAGPVGALAGDLVGALVARQVVNIGESAMTAHDQLRQQKRFQEASKLERTKQMVQATLDEMGKKEESLGDELTGDLAGWLIGNASAMGLSMLPVVGKIPMKGAAVAMSTVPAIVKLRRKYAKAQSG